jgi:hypothetical protein
MRGAPVHRRRTPTAAASAPLSYVGARVAVRADAVRLERVHGAVLLVLGVTLFVLR